MKTKATVLAVTLLLMTLVPMAYAKGYDDYGYNYKANMFNGWYGNYARPHDPVDDGDTHLIMKWNDAWLNEDKIRHEGHPSYDGSGAWLTNHMWGKYEDGTKWQYFVKIITPSTGAGDYLDAGIWYTKDGAEIGPVIWGAFAVIQEFENNRNHEVIYKSPSPVGFGVYSK